MSKTLLLSPRISEKSYLLSQTSNVFVFDVPLKANQLQIKQAIEAQYSVTVEQVRTMIAKGKSKKTALKRKQPRIGKRIDVKKAYVTLKKGDSISIFETEGEA